MLEVEQHDTPRPERTTSRLVRGTATALHLKRFGIAVRNRFASLWHVVSGFSRTSQVRLKAGLRATERALVCEQVANHARGLC